jgi:hypothetical protein
LNDIYDYFKESTTDKFQPLPGKIWPIAGRTSGGLAKCALSYETMFKKTNRPVDKALVNEFIYRSGDWNLVDKLVDRFSVKELVAAAQFIRPMIKSTPEVVSPKFQMVLKLVWNSITPETEQDLLDMIEVAESMWA